MPRAIEHYDRAVEILARQGNETSLAVALVGRASAHHMAGRFDLAFEDLERTDELARRLGNDALHAASDMIAAVILEQRGHLADALARGRGAVETARRLNLGFVASLAASTCTGVHRIALEPRVALEVADEALEHWAWPRRRSSGRC